MTDPAPSATSVATRRRAATGRTNGRSTDGPAAQDWSGLFTVLDMLTEPVVIRDAEGSYLAVNGAWETATGLTRSHVVGRRPEVNLPSEQAAFLDAGHARALADGQFSDRLVLTYPGRAPIVVEATWVAVELHGQPVTVALARDVTHTESGVQAQAWLASVINATTDAVISTRNEITQSWNPAAEEILGYRAADMVGRPLMRVEASLAADPAKWFELISRVRGGEGIHGEEMPWVHPDGTVRIIAVTATRIPADISGHTGTSWVIRDVGREVQRRRALERESMTDEVTGLLNRRALSAVLDNAGPHGGAILIADVDDLSGINDRVGHQGGDAVLRIIASRMVDAAGPGAVVARVGGDEFAVWCPGLDVTQAQTLAKEIYASVAVPISADRVSDLPATSELHVTLSVGVATSDGSPTEALLVNADVAEAEAKSHRSGPVIVYDPQVHEKVKRRRRLATDIHTAITRDELRLVYQPVIALRDGSIGHVEALARWSHPELGEISPEEFIPLAEQSHAIAGVGEWVLRTAARTAAAWQGSPELDGVGVAVNVSPLRVVGGDLAGEIAAALTATGLPASLLTLEVTETAFVEDLDTMAAELRLVRELGVRVAIDDFGIGYSSLSYLHRIPATEIKIDRSITADLTTDPDAFAITESVIQLASTLGLQVVAEGVETADQHAILAELGATHAQGWLFARATSAEQLGELSRSRWSPMDAHRQRGDREQPGRPQDAGPSPEATSGLVGSYLVAPDRYILSWDEGAAALTGYSAEDVVGRSCSDGLLLSHTDADGYLLCGSRCPLKETIKDGQPRSARVYFRHAQGHRVPAKVRAEPIRSSNGTILGAVESFHVEDTHGPAMLRMATARNRGRDPLTGLAQVEQARAWVTAIGRDTEESTGAAISLTLATTSGDEHQAPVADETTLAAARTLVGVVHPGDLVCRTGPASFVVLTHASTRGDLYHYANALRRHTRTVTTTSSGPVHVSLAIAALASPTDRATWLATLAPAT